jgi:hypothetical protein
MPRGASVVIAVVIAFVVTGCGAGGAFAYEAHSRGQTMALCTDLCNQAGGATLTATLKADSVLINVSARLGLQTLVAFCAPSVNGTSDQHVLVMETGSPGEEGHGTSFQIEFPSSLPQAHDYICGFRIRRPKGVSSATYARRRAAYVHGALLALRLSRR